MKYFFNKYHKSKIMVGVFTLLISSQLALGQTIPIPEMPTITNTPGQIVLTMSGTPPAGIEWYWQHSAEGESTFLFHQNYYDTVSIGVEQVFLRARQSSSLLWSDALTINYTVDPNIPDPPTITNFPGYTALSKNGTPVEGQVWYWQNSATGQSFSGDASAESIYLTEGTTYYLRSYKPSTSTWGEPLVINYTVDSFPTQITEESHIYTTIPRIETTDISTITDEDQKIETITYFDALGQPIQNIGIRAGGNKEDIITPMEYDGQGRQAKEYLPYAEATNGGVYRAHALITANSLNTVSSFYNTPKYENTLNPYSEKHFEASPLNRVLEQGAPGTDWALDKVNDTDHTIKFEYATNSIHDYVAHYGVSFVSGNIEVPQLQDKGLYAVNELYKTVTKDENWVPNQIHPTDHTTEEYKDGQGRVVLKRTFSAGKWHDTYYVYDDFGNLTFVLPPKIATSQWLKQQSYAGQYYYFTDVTTLYASPVDDSSIHFQFTSNGLLNIYIYGISDAMELADGLVMNLNFMSPSLPDMNLGSISSSYGDFAGTAYIQGGDLYFNSNGIVIYSDEDMYGFSLSVDLSNNHPIFNLPAINQTQLDDLTYQYKYDIRNRLIEKKIPEKGWEYIVYDKLDRPVLTQDANLRAANNANLTTDQWLFTKYDALGRVVYTGLYESNKTRSQLQQDDLDTETVLFESAGAVTLDGINTYYTNNAFPRTSILNIYTINYYDDYTFDTDVLVLPSESLGSVPIINYDNTAPIKTKGLVTGSKVKVLETSHWITTVTGYDKKGRAIYVANKNNYLNTLDVTQRSLDFVGHVILNRSRHYKGSNTIQVDDFFVYDHVGRLISQNQNIYGSQELIVKNEYDELGQLVKKDVGNTEAQPLQNIDYTYNIRGWLKQINNPASLQQDGDLFSFGLNYNTPEGPTTYYNKPLYNGNISHVYWKTDNTSSDLRQYNYTYDALNRFKRAYYAENQTSKYDYYALVNNYDRNGNILDLNRFGLNPATSSYYPIDILSYTYNEGNKLLEVSDSFGTNSISNSMGGFKDGTNSGSDYYYDANGNMTKDLNKGISDITYNHLNLPDLVTINDGGSNVGNISYIYDAMGNKLNKKVTHITGSDYTWTKTYYAGNYVYENYFSSCSECPFAPPPPTPIWLKYSSHPEGYIAPKNENNLSQGFDYIYQYKDHLGNVRLSYQDIDGNGSVNSSEILEENNYYPFGLKHKGYNNVVNSSNIALKRKFGGKEYQDELDLGWYDITARNYDPAIGRWMNIDPRAEEMRRWSPYNYAYNSPLQFTDSDGLAPDWVPSFKNGKIILTAERGDNAETLAQFFAGRENASKYIDDIYFNSSIQYSEGSVVRFNDTNVYSQGIDWYNNDGEDAWCNTVCHGVAMLGTRGQSLTDLGGEGNQLSNFDFKARDYILDTQYNQIDDAKDAVFGNTVITFGSNHSAVYFGTDNSENHYFLSKHNRLWYSIDDFNTLNNDYNSEGNLPIGAYTIRFDFSNSPLTNELLQEIINYIYGY